MKNDPILRVLKYFAFFSYPPTLKEIHLFLDKPISLKKLGKIMEKKVKTGEFRAQEIDALRYTFSGKVNFFERKQERNTYSSRKIEKLTKYLTILNRLPNLLLTGISGSVAMKNAKMTDDLDIFIITIPNRLWTARFCVIILAYILGIKRNRGDKNVTDKVCLNLFFDGRNVKIPDEKRNEYVGHEVLQLKPVLNRNSTYERFLYENGWVRDFFPNAPLPKRAPKLVSKGSVLGNMVEDILRRVQLWIMSRHRTSEIISDTQLWFFPKDFQRTLEKHVPLRE
jgi:hypothetical protein